MATLLNLINEVLRKAGQREVATVVNAETPAIQTIDFLNQIYFDMLQSLKVNRLNKAATLTTVAGTVSYTLASDAEINTVLGDSVVDQEKSALLQEVDHRYPLQHGVSATGRPNRFYRKDDRMYFYPVPDAVYTIAYHYLVKPVRLEVDAATTKLPEEWERILVQGTLALLEKFLGEGGYHESYALFRENVNQLRARAQLKPNHTMKGFYRGSKP